MADKIGTQTGIVATNTRFKAVDPGHDAGYNNLAATLTTLVSGHNEYQDRLVAVEGAINTFPFPGAS